MLSSVLMLLLAMIVVPTAILKQNVNQDNTNQMNPEPELMILFMKTLKESSYKLTVFSMALVTNTLDEKKMV